MTGRADTHPTGTPPEPPVAAPDPEATIRGFVTGNGYEIVVMEDGNCSAVPLVTASVLAALDALVRERQQLRDTLALAGEVIEAVPDRGKLLWLAAVLDVMDDLDAWPESMPYVLNGQTIDLAVDGSGDAVQRDLRALADALASTDAVLAGEGDATHG